tara:strand:- start:47526 stop:48197 length:672 start_codon:yes stop_codon:yes gene_type:complete
MSKLLNIKTFDPEVFVEKAAEELRRILIVVLKNPGIITVALSGGNSPLPVYEKLSKFHLDWTRITFFLVDERCSTVDSSDNNYKNIKRVFFDHIESKAHAVIISGKPYQECVQAYQKNILNNVQITNNIPSFDLIVLGMGTDGHIASLFPNTEALQEKEDLVVLNKVPQLNTERITMTYPVIMNSKKIALLIRGEEKKQVLLNAKKQNFPVSTVLSKIDVILN